MAASSDQSDPGRGEITPEEREAFRRRAAELTEKLDSVKAQRPPAVSQKARGAAYGQAMKIAVELVVGIAIGLFIGRLLDQQFGTAPVLMILLLLLGFAAGLANVIRSAKRMQAEAEPLQRAAKSVQDDEED